MDTATMQNLQARAIPLGTCKTSAENSSSPTLLMQTVGQRQTALARDNFCDTSRSPTKGLCLRAKPLDVGALAATTLLLVMLWRAVLVEIWDIAWDIAERAFHPYVSVQRRIFNGATVTALQSSGVCVALIFCVQLERHDMLYARLQARSTVGLGSAC